MTIKRDIQKTIEYAKKMGGSLAGASEIEERLIGNKVYGIDKIEEYLEKNKKWKTSLENKRDLRWRDRKMEIAGRVAKEMADKFDELLFAGVTGSVAAGYPKKSDDIDMMIVSKADRLWILRLKVKWWLIKKKIKHRKWGDKGARDGFCFNLWLDETALEIPQERRNLRVAVDMMLVRPLIDRNEIYNRLLKKNGWVKRYLATPYQMKNKTAFVKRKGFKKNDWILKFWNLICFWGQYGYMKRRMKGELVKRNEAYFTYADKKR